MHLNNKKDWVIKTNLGDMTQVKKLVDDITKDEIDILPTSNLSTRGKNVVQKKFNLESIADVTNVIANFIRIHINKQVKIASGWTVYGQEDSYHTIHVHSSRDKNDIATVLYLSTAEVIDGHEGNLFLIPKDDEFKQFNPIVGDLFVFPTYVMHGTYPQGKGLRQTLNLDFEVL
tara:strand:- start:892 stop:1413 length:522 start_codon:yes stop_codon:yes gene_type:complete